MSALSPSEVLELLDPEASVEKRASWEAFEFTILEGGNVEVVNGSHDEPEEHTYTVHIEGGIPFSCTCPAWEYQNGACKHMVSVAIRGPLLEAVNAEPTVKPDGGVTVEAEKNSHSDERPEDCNCTPFSEELPCWACYKDGFEKPNPNVGEDE